MREFEAFWEWTWGYTQVVTHPAIIPLDRGLNLEFSGERQRANRIRSPQIYMPYFDEIRIYYMM